jgi:hypothetical protein
VAVQAGIPLDLAARLQGDTEDALALVVRWLREVGLAPRVTRKGATVTTSRPGKRRSRLAAMTSSMVAKVTTR